MNAPQLVKFLTRHRVEVWREGDRLQLKPPKPLKPKLMQMVAALKSDLLPLVEERARPAEEEASPELWEIREGLCFNGGECAARLLVAVCRLSHNVKEIEARLREGEPLGLWKRMERTDALGFPIWSVYRQIKVELCIILLMRIDLLKTYAYLKSLHSLQKLYR